ncbi:hypothetical protein [uncultured Hymenobacter sp.]
MQYCSVTAWAGAEGQVINPSSVLMQPLITLRPLHDFQVRRR